MVKTLQINAKHNLNNFINIYKTYFALALYTGVIVQSEVGLFM